MELNEINTSNQLVYCQILVALVNIFLFYPFSHKFSIFITKITSSRGEENLTQPRYLDEDMLNVPTISVLLLSKEMIRLADYLEAYYQMLLYPDSRPDKLYDKLPAGITELSEYCAEYMYKIRISGEFESLLKRFSTLTYTMTIFSDIGKLLTGALRKRLDDAVIRGILNERLGVKMWEEFSGACLKMMRTSLRAFVIKESGLIEEANRFENMIAKMSLDARKILVENSFYGRDASQIIHLISLLQGLTGMCKEVAQGEEF